MTTQRRNTSLYPIWTDRYISSYPWFWDVISALCSRHWCFDAICLYIRKGLSLSFHALYVVCRLLEFYWCGYIAFFVLTPFSYSLTVWSRRTAAITFGSRYSQVDSCLWYWRSVIRNHRVFTHTSRNRTCTVKACLKIFKAGIELQMSRQCVWIYKKSTVLILDTKQMDIVSHLFVRVSL